MSAFTCNDLLVRCGFERFSHFKQETKYCDFDFQTVSRLNNLLDVFFVVCLGYDDDAVISIPSLMSTP